MMEFWAGLVLGAVFGVVTDRIWEWVEAKPRVRLINGYFHHIRDGRGLNYSIENTGKREIHPFQIVLFHPDRGSLMVFEPAMQHGLLPGQTIEMRCALDGLKQSNAPLHHWLEHARGKAVETILDGRFVLQLRMLNSDHLIYESTKNGNAFARLMLRAVRDGEFGTESWEEALELRGDTTAFIRRWIRSVKERRATKAMLETHGTEMSVRAQ